ncbi:hypothetical protein M9Y10_038057 [Tritrichomonas musculus]|uniref:Uncharacterized protein n=1 Tax=Tritrichomonas musculus TaxID=1915356 RepID=A0ABR2K7X7_9EUKA
MLKESQKSLPIKKKIVKGTIEKSSANKLQMQAIVEYFFQYYQYFQKYRKLSKSLTEMTRKLKSIYAELDSLSQLKATKTTKTLLLDLQNRWENLKSQISSSIQIIDTSDYPALIGQQFTKLQSIIEKVNQSPPSTPILQKESTYMYGSLISQISNLMINVKDTSDVSNSKSLLQNFRNDLSHSYETFFKNSQVSKVWKRSVIEECTTCVDRIYYFLDFSSGSKFQLPVDPDLISNEFNQLLSYDYPSNNLRNSRAISVTSNAETPESKTIQKKTITQIPKPSRSQSAQNELKSRSCFPLSKKNNNTSKKKNSEYLTNSENDNKNIIENSVSNIDDRDSFSRSHSIADDNLSLKNLRSSINSVSSIASATPKCKKSRLPKRTTPDTPQTDVRPIIRTKALTRLNQSTKISDQFTPSKPKKEETNVQPNEIITSPTQITSLCNSPQIHIKEEMTSVSEAFPVKGIPFPKEEEIFSNFNDIVPLKESPKLSFKSQGNHSPVLHTNDKGNTNTNKIKNLSESIVNHYSLEELISDSDSDEIIAAVSAENEKSPALGKLRKDLASITQANQLNSIDIDEFQNALENFLHKLEDHKSLIQANHLLDILFQMIQRTLETIHSGQNRKAAYQVSKIQNLLSLIEEEFIDNLTLDQIDINIFEAGKEIKNLADSFFKADPTQPIMDQFEAIQTRLKNITEGNVNHYLFSELQKLISMKSQIKEFVERVQQMKKSQSSEKKKLLSEINSIQQRIILLNGNKSNPVFSSEDIEHEISDLLSKQQSLIQKLTSLEDLKAY